MNTHDRQNLEFLIGMTEQGLKKWLNQASEDDVAYANELLVSWELEMIQQEQELGQEIYGAAFVSHSAQIH